MKRNKKEERDKENQNMARLIVAVLSGIIFLHLVYDFVRSASLEALGMSKIVALFLFPILIPLLIWKHRKEEKQLRKLKKH